MTAQFSGDAAQPRPDEAEDPRDAGGRESESVVTSIPIEPLAPAASVPGEVLIRPVLLSEIPGVTTDCLSIAGPARYAEPARADAEVVWLFLTGGGFLRTGGFTFQIYKETIARAPSGWSWDMEVPAGENLLAVRVCRQVTDDDRAEQVKSPGSDPVAYVRQFAHCTPYCEAIKSAKAISRTILPENIVPRLAMGTVETTGPDVVARHKHPMLEQLFVGLREDNGIVTADKVAAAFSPLSILRIPPGSIHGVEVAEGDKLHYVWIDCFATKEGQEWLKTHKPVQDGSVGTRVDSHLFLS